MPAGTTIFSNDYENGATADWVSANAQGQVALVTEGENTYLSYDISSARPNDRGANYIFSDEVKAAAGSAYAIEFDAAIKAGDDHSTEFSILGADFAYGSKNMNNGTTVGTIIKMEAPKNSTSWTIQGLNTPAELAAGTFYHYRVAVKDTSAYLTIEAADGTKVVDNQLIAVNGAGGLGGIYFKAGRYTAGVGIDNVLVRTLNDGEVPDINFYNLTINTTRFANMTTADGTKYYADANGKIEIPLLVSGTKIDYTLTKVGYADVTGSVTITDADVVEEKPMTMTDENIIFIESDFGSESGAWVAPDGSRGDSISLGSTTLPDVSEIKVDVTCGVLNATDQQRTWALVTDAGAIVGLQFTQDGVYAWTGWTGDVAYNKSSDKGAYTNGEKIAEYASGEKLEVSFVIDKTSKSITVSDADSSVSLPYTIEATAVTGMAAGMYRYYASLTVDEIKISKPDPTFMTIGGDTQIAKIGGKTVTREYSRTETVITPDETFAWTIAREDGKSTDGITVADGVLSITDAAEPGEITLTATGTTGKTASLKINVEDFANVTANVEGPASYKVGQTGSYAVTSLKDEYNDDVFDLFTPAFASDNTDVITIDAETGVAEAKANGTANITVTIGNEGKKATVTIPVTVAVYSITAAATGDKTAVDTTGIVSGDGIVGYLVTTSKDGVIVSQKTMTAEEIAPATATVTKVTTPVDAVKVTAVYADNRMVSVSSEVLTANAEVDTTAAEGTKVLVWKSLASMEPVELSTTTETTTAPAEFDTAGADKIDIAPIYETKINTLVNVPAGRYNVTITASNGRRTDVYVNDQMVFNNVNQGSDSWTVGRIVAESTDYTVNDVMINQGYAKFNLRDDQSGGATITNVRFVEAPASVKRATRVYVIGDSLTANYYGTAPEGSEGLVRTGWGQVMQNYVAEGVEVTNLGNSGAWATGMLHDAFTAVKESAQEGDIILIESGYNDRNHTTMDEMKAAVAAMVEGSRAKGAIPFVITPNASRHDYTSSVVSSGSIREVATETGATLIDLSADSYAFLSAKYGEDAAAANDVLISTYNNAGDTLHSSYNAANCWATIVAQGVYNSGITDVFNTDYSYTFNDGTNDITVKVTAPAAE